MIVGLTDYARHGFELSKADKQGHSQRDHLTAVWKKTGRRPPELIPPPVNRSALYLMEWFSEISAGRSWGDAGPHPIGPREFLAFSQLNGLRMKHWERRAIMQIDAAWREVMTRKPKKEGEAT